MRAGSTVYTIEAESGGAKVPADLGHLQKMLEQEGFTIDPSLEDPQFEREGIAPISVKDRHLRNYLRYAGIHSFIRRHEGKFQLVADSCAEILDEFAKRYEPVPLSKY